MSKLVGYKGDVWSGGAFPSKKRTPQAAAAEHFKKAAKSLSGGFLNDTIRKAIITDFAHLEAWVLDLTKDADGSKPKSWTIARHDTPPKKASRRGMAKKVDRKAKRP